MEDRQDNLQNTETDENNLQSSADYQDPAAEKGEQEYTDPNKGYQTQNSGYQYQNNGYQNGGYQAQNNGYQYQNNGYQNGGYQYQNGGYQYQNPRKDSENGMDTRPMSMGEWMLTILIMLIPCVNIVVYLIWAFGKTGNVNRRNYCRAYLIFYVIILVLAIIFSVVFGIAAASTLTYY